MRYRIHHCGIIVDTSFVVVISLMTNATIAFAMQQFTDEELQYIENYMSGNFPNDLINGCIKQMHQHSDNALQHFKSTGALEYFCISH
jgi:hypothetical protein